MKEWDSAREKEVVTFSVLSSDGRLIGEWSSLIRDVI
nr:hypothetical protein [Bacillus sp. 1021]